MPKITNLKRRRNELINQEFNRVLRKHLQRPAGFRLMEVYEEVAERFCVSVTTVRYAVKGYGDYR
jgi:hypothetical protein